MSALTATAEQRRATCGWPRRLVLLGCLLAVMARLTGADPAPSREYQIKAAFLFNFAQFVEWPATAFADADAPIRIGVLGEDPFGAALDETVRNETIRNRKLVVQRAQQLDELKNCHLVFISRSEKARLADVLAGLAQLPVLTVSEIDGFAERGGAIRFYLVGNKVRFEINPSAAQQRGLKMSAQLLNLGKIIAPATSREHE